METEEDKEKEYQKISNYIDHISDWNLYKRMVLKSMDKKRWKVCHLIAFIESVYPALDENLLEDFEEKLDELLDGKELDPGERMRDDTKLYRDIYRLVVRFSNKAGMGPKHQQDNYTLDIAISGDSDES